MAKTRSYNSKLINLNQRLEQLEQLKDSEAKQESRRAAAVGRAPERSERRSAPLPPRPEKGTGYFGNVQRAGKCFFNGLATERDYTSKFSARYDGIRAEFEPLGVKALKACDCLDKAIKAEGDLQLESASTLEVVEPGRAVRDNGGRWLIESPCRVVFS